MTQTKPTTRSFKIGASLARSFATHAVHDYATHAIAAAGADESPIALFVAVLETTNASELVHLGRAILARHDSLCDDGYRIGEPHADPAISVLADALGKLAA